MNDVFTVDESSECVSAFQSPGGADDRAPFDPHHAVMAARLDHLRVERRGTEDPTDDRPVELEAGGDDQGTCCELHARRDVTNDRQGVPVAGSPADSRRPETRPDLKRREHPRRPRLPPGERPDRQRRREDRAFVRSRCCMARLGGEREENA